MDSQVLVALALCLVGGLSTSIGALFVVLNQAPNLKMLGLLQGFAAGLMLSISFFDLAHNAINAVGFLKGNLWGSFSLLLLPISSQNRLLLPFQMEKVKRHKLAHFSRRNGCVSWIYEGTSSIFVKILGTTTYLEN
ncbi:zinc transporter ZTP29-like isoform X2 [Rhododendron vialii]|uniref:zinc transporter ZTP29-like isoform X2 n=1 Tax=Rhododendron vialii TaxID=182163 RepID=UPI00265FD9A2|nr:zinc transporter ZTP29-like isoform X2 [Rhododendron vialii]